MKSVFWLTLLFALAVAAALGAQANEGYLLLVAPPYRLEISLNLAIFALIALVFGVHLVLRLVAVAVGLPAAARAYQRQRQRERAAGVFQDAVRLLFEGRFGQAMRRAEQAHGEGTAVGLSALIAARAAQRMRETDKQRYWLEHARNDDPRTEAATLMLDAEMANEERRFDAALAALARLQSNQGRHIAALRLELRARQGIGDWDGVLKLVRQLNKRRALMPEVVREIVSQAHLANLAVLQGDASRLQKYLAAIPDAERTARVLLAGAEALAAQGLDADLRQLIESALGQGDTGQWQSGLALLYARVRGEDMTSRIARAEGWLRRQPDDACLLLALGRMCLQQRLWGKAQNYLEASLSLDASRDAHLELARLFDQLEKSEAANLHYRAAASLQATA